MVAFAVIEGTILLLLAVTLLTHVAWNFVSAMMDCAARLAEEEKPPQPARPLIEFKGKNDDDELDDYEPDESWLHPPVLVGPRRNPLRL